MEAHINEERLHFTFQDKVRAKGVGAGIIIQFTLSKRAPVPVLDMLHSKAVTISN